MNSPTKQYYVAKDGQTLGPYTEETIYQCLKEGRLAQADYVLHPEKQEWVSIATATFLKFNAERPLPPLPQAAALPPLPTAAPLVVVRTRESQSIQPSLLPTANIPVTFSHDHEPSGSCPLCGRDMKKPKELYGKKVCEKCVDAFANQRASAFIIDCFAFLLPIFILVPVIFILFPSTNESVVKIFIGLAGFVLLSLKDSFSGKSLGKRTCKIRVIDTQTGNPIGAKASFVRNFILFIPYINWITQIFCAIEMRKGPRTGDKWAHTKVIWDKYSDKSPFSFSGKTD